MAVAFCLLVSLANGLSLLLFKGAAVAVLLLVWLIKIPSFIIGCLLSIAAEVFKRSAVLLFKFLKDISTSDSGAEFIGQARTCTYSFLRAAMTRLDEGFSIMFMNLKEVSELMKCGCTFLSQFLPDVIESSWWTIIQMVSDILKNMKDSFKYFMENI